MYRRKNKRVSGAAAISVQLKSMKGAGAARLSRDQYLGAVSSASALGSNTMLHLTADGPELAPSRNTRSKAALMGGKGAGPRPPPDSTAHARRHK